MKMMHHDSQLKSRKTVGENRQSIGVFRGKRKGITLIEVVISLALFSILAIPVAAFVNGSISLNKKAEAKQQAALLGQSILEELASVGQLVVGTNGLFGLTDVELSDVCDEVDYCIKKLALNGFEVNLDFNELGLAQENSRAIEANQLESKEELFIQISNKTISGGIENERESEIGQEDKDELTITIDGNNKVLISNKTESTYLDGTLTNGNILIEIQNNNQNHELSKITINNNSNLSIQGCLANKDANGHITITPEKIEVNGQVNIQVLENKEVCLFNHSEEAPDNSGNGQNPQLFEAKITIYSKNKDLIFNGTRVVSLEIKND